MKLKLGADNNVILQDGKPVYVHDDGKEVPFDAPSAVAKIKELNGEAKTHREAKEAAEAKLQIFSGIEDPAAAIKALETIKNIDDKKLFDAGRVEEIKNAAIKTAQDQFTAAAKSHAEEVQKLKEQVNNTHRELHGERVGGSFSRSKYINEKVSIPSDIMQAMFGERFKSEEGKIVAYDAAGNRLFSRTKPGELAGFEEAIETLVDSYANKDSILKGTQAAGSGSRPSSGGTPGAKTMSRADFNATEPSKRAEVIRAGTQITD